MRLLVILPLVLLFAVAAIGFFHLRKRLPDGLDFRGPERILPSGSVDFLADITAFHGPEEQRWTRHEIFDEAIRRIGEADAFIVADFFLVNEFAGGPPEGAGEGPSLSERFVEALVDAARARPAMPVLFITDPINTVYGAVDQPLFGRLRSAGVEVVLTDLRQLRDGNLVFSPFWRTFFEWWGDPRGEAVENPLGEGKIGWAAFLELLNFKANHRKVLVTGSREDGLFGLVTSGNPHSASALHGNVALAFGGPLAADLLRTEEAVYRFTTGRNFPPAVRTFLDPAPATGSDETSLTAVVLTERAIKRELLDRIGRLEQGDEADLALFYFADFDLREALAAAESRGANVRLLLDPNKDAFGRAKNGIPNRQVGAWLSERGVEVRWYRTRGEQFHAKMALFRYGGATGTLVVGSANWTRRNLANLNLETSVSVSGPLRDPVFVEAANYFSFVWSNAFWRGRGSVPQDLETSAPFAEYRDTSWWRRALYRIMEATGASTF